ncbi:MAG: hypothetical protein Q7U26_18405 [Aquabacterium sp.]|nr:hypothetical protein [Aquabacterium sp.]
MSRLCLRQSLRATELARLPAARLPWRGHLVPVHLNAQVPGIDGTRAGREESASCGAIVARNVCGSKARRADKRADNDRLWEKVCICMPASCHGRAVPKGRAAAALNANITPEHGLGDLGLPSRRQVA